MRRQTTDASRGGTIAELIRAAQNADPRAVARLISMVENSAAHSRQMRELTAALAPHTGRAELIGVTGPPGVGKSTLVAAMAQAYRANGLRVGVLAVDPTSPFTGGALLGDRVRMQDLATDTGVFIRSMATRGHLGGLSIATPQAVRVLDAAGCEVVLVETVGVGQSEVEVAGQADTTLVLLAPGQGDAVQIAKAGVLEIGDIYVVNKADRDGAERVSRDLRQMLALAASASTDRRHRDGRRAGPADPAGRHDRDDRGDGVTWSPPIVPTCALSADDTGVSKLVETVASHRRYLDNSGELVRRRAARVRAEVEGLALEAMRVRIGAVRGDERLDRLVDDVLQGVLDPYQAADTLVAGADESR